MYLIKFSACDISSSVKISQREKFFDEDIRVDVIYPTNEQYVCCFSVN